MKLVNRGFILATPTNKFNEWANSHNEDSIFSNNTINEASCYLIEDEFWEEDSLLEKYFKKISQQEFYPVSQNNEDWPKIENIDAFKEYFTTEFGSFVYDLLAKDLSRESI